MCIFHIALAVELKGQGHIMFQIIDYVGHISKSTPYDQQLSRYHDLSAFAL